MTDTRIKIPQRGRPPVDIDWPDVVFTAQDVVDTSTKRVSRVTIHSKLNKAVDAGVLSVVGVSKSENGRPRVKYKKTQTSAPSCVVPVSVEGAEEDGEKAYMA